MRKNLKHRFRIRSASLRARLLVATIALLQVSLSGCQEAPSNRICTQIGCGDMGLSVTIHDLPDGEHEVALTADGKTRILECESSIERTVEDRSTNTVMHSGGPCGVFLPGKWKEIEVSVNGRYLGRHELEYRAYYPNGPHCAPECQGASLEIDFED